MSSIVKKVSMGLAGLMLAVFLGIHLGVNLGLLYPDNGVLYNQMSRAMTESLLIKGLEVLLGLSLVVHIGLSIYLVFDNKKARPIGYASGNKTQASFMSKQMMHTGGIILIFLAIHLVHFYFVKQEWVDLPKGVAHAKDFYALSMALFSQVGYVVFYVICFIALAFHLQHALQSIWITLGFEHHKYTPIINRLATMYAVCIGVGFSLIPLYILFTK